MGGSVEKARGDERQGRVYISPLGGGPAVVARTVRAWGRAMSKGSDSIRLETCLRRCRRRGLDCGHISARRGGPETEKG